MPRLRFNACSVISIFLLLSVHAASAQNPPQFVTHHDTIPNFAHVPTITSAASGPWSSVGTWQQGRIPAAADVVLIRRGHTVILDSSNAAAQTVGIEGNAGLEFLTNAVTKLTVVNILVMVGGSLQVGTKDSPVEPGVSATIEIADAPIETGSVGSPGRDPRQFGSGIVVIDGKASFSGRAMPRTWIEFASEPSAGSSVLTLKEPAIGWQAGDRLFIPESRHLTHADFSPYVYQGEYVTIAAIDPSKTQLTLTASLRYNHPGARDAFDVLRYLPHAANLTRNVIIRSANPLGTRGHTMFMGRTELYSAYASFLNLGRTTTEILNSARFDSSGAVTHIGTNQMGRYAFHMHHLIGPEIPNPDGFQSYVIGNIVEGGKKWGITVHNTHFAQITDNVVLDVQGSGLMMEEGNESFNHIERNFFSRVTGIGGRADSRSATGEYGYQGEGMWISSTYRNKILRNVVTNSSYHTLIYFTCGSCRIPKFQGADNHHGENYFEVNMSAHPLENFEDNMAYGLPTGMEVWGLGANIIGNYASMQQSVIKRFVIWHFTSLGFFNYPSKNLVIDGFVAIGKKGVNNNHHETLTGITYGDYQTNGSNTAYSAAFAGVVKSEFHNLNTGIQIPQKVGDRSVTGNARISFNIRDSVFYNTRGGIGMGTQFGVTGGGWSLTPRVVEVERCTFADGASPNHREFSRSDFVMWFQQNGSNQNILVGPDFINVKDSTIDGVSGRNFQVYYYAQHPEFIVPVQGLDTGVGSPEPNLTNQQFLAKYGAAIGGQIAPCVQSSERVYGFACGANPPPRVREPRLVSIIPLPLRSGSTITWQIDVLTAEPSKITINSWEGLFPPVSSNQLKTLHRLLIPNIQPGAGTLRYRITAESASGHSVTMPEGDMYNLWSTPHVDPAIDSTPPVLRAAWVTFSMPTAMTVVWLTEEPADTQLEYGTSTALGTTTALDSQLIGAHAVHLSGLQPGAEYFYRVRSKDAAGNLRISDIQSVRLPATAESSVPYVAITSPGPDSLHFGGSLDVEYKVSGNVPAGWRVYLTLSGKDSVVDWDRDGKISFPDITTRGEYHVTAFLTDGSNMGLSPQGSEGTRVYFMAPSGASNQGPRNVSAGPDRRVTVGSLVSLSGSAEDDGLPFPPGRMTFTWSAPSGPGVVNFTSPGAASTGATFLTAGTYQVRLTANDSELSAHDELTVLVEEPAGGSDRIAPGPPRNLRLVSGP